MSDIRAFIALPIAAAVREELAALIEAVRRPRDGTRWVRPDGIHLTLAFLGSIPETTVAAIDDALNTVAAERAPFTIRTTATGGFPTLRRPRVLWVGLEASADHPLQRLQAAVAGALVPIGHERDERPFRPHLTVGRVKEMSRAPEVGERVGAYRFPALTWHADRVHLMRSDLHPSGARYTVLREVLLTGDGG